MPETALDTGAWLSALAAILLAAVVAWAVSVIRRDVSIVDSLWSLLFVLGLGVYVAVSDVSGPRVWMVTAMVTAWALRLSIYITARNHRQPEDRRYQAIRQNNEPHFWLKSLYIVFLLQGFLAWVVCLPALAAVSGRTPPGRFTWVEGLGVALWLAGMFFEVVGDWQLAALPPPAAAGRRARQRPGGIRGIELLRRSAAVVGIYLVALSAGAWWAVVSPLLLTFLLLRVSGVALLERTSVSAGDLPRVRAPHQRLPAGAAARGPPVQLRSLKP
jgi:steroid 5-alpha reductase family enzyme